MCTVLNRYSEHALNLLLSTDLKSRQHLKKGDLPTSAGDVTSAPPTRAANEPQGGEEELRLPQVPLPGECPKEQGQRGAGSQQTVPPTVTWSPSHPSHRGPHANSQLINYSPRTSQAPKKQPLFHITFFPTHQAIPPLRVVVWDRHGAAG